MTGAALLYSDDQMQIHRIVVGPYENNVFVVRCNHTGQAVLIDAANEHEKLLEMCTALGVTRVLETHGHHDHIGAVPAMREAGYQVAVTAEDAPMLKDVGYDVFIADGEGYDLIIQLVHDTDRLAVPYTADYAREHDESDSLKPWETA